MTTGIYISYGGVTLGPPTPLCNFSQIPIQFGYLYSYETAIDLQGFVTGITNTGQVINYLTGIFSNQFQDLLVQDDQNNVLYNWSGITVESISLDQNTYFQGSFVKYNIKLKSWAMPSGILQPSNAYSFTEREDGSVSVLHSISAQGVRNSNPAFQNAISFVQTFTGQDAFGSCIPYLVPSGSGVLLSVSENINRAEAIYSVTENYLYNTGVISPFVKKTSLEISDGITEEFRVVDYNLKIQGSPINNNLNSIITNNLNYGMLADIQNEFGYNTTNWIKNTYNASVDSGAATIDIKVGYVSGANPSGFLDYSVTCTQNFLNNTENWKIEGDFRTFGPLDYRLNQIQIFKNTNGGNNWRTFLTGLIISSPVFSGNHNNAVNFSPNCDVEVTENSQLAELKLSLNMEDGFEPMGLDSLKYAMDSEPSRWIYELLAGATIEGDYVVQNLQAATRPKQKFTFEGNTYNTASGLSILSGYLQGISSTYVQSGSESNVTAFLVNAEITTGVFDVSHTQTWIGQDNGISAGLLSLQAVGSNTISVPTRNSGFFFGY